MIASRVEIAKSDVATHYDELDTFYRDVWGEHVHHGLWLTGSEDRETAVQQLVWRVAEEAGIKKGAEVCDVGCGYGATSRALADRFGVRVTGVTISPAQYAFASSQAGEREDLNFVLGDWLENALPAGAFDAVVAIESSEHMADKVGFFAQAARVLQPGGRLVVCAWLEGARASASGRRWLLEPICREGRMPGMGTAADYRKWGEDAGFELLRAADVSCNVAPTWPRIVRTFLRKLMRNPRYARFLLDRHARNRVFALTIFRIWLAYRTGTMEYGVFTFRKGTGTRTGVVQR